ncbi:hypothetical protein MANES_10G026351v8 [Manihot esculenta]|uniref:Uncharacterized protein n=1 Tax=Manihot esculenta TaxID=3983 RepID=A0ACB7GXD3_MANES|nr:hypothetical protein MANES_10G026351v8 [Manihot esculenta]
MPWHLFLSLFSVEAVLGDGCSFISCPLFDDRRPCWFRGHDSGG